MPSRGTSGGCWFEGGDDSGLIFCSCNVWATGSAVLGTGCELITGVSSTITNTKHTWLLLKLIQKRLIIYLSNHHKEWATTSSLCDVYFNFKFFSGIHCTCSFNIKLRRKIYKPEFFGLKSSSFKWGKKVSILSQVSFHSCDSPPSAVWNILAVSITNSMFFKDSGIASDYTGKWNGIRKSRFWYIDYAFKREWKYKCVVHLHVITNKP